MGIATPTKIPSLVKGISAGLWVDLEASWAAAPGREAAVTCTRSRASDSGNRSDFHVGSPLCTAAVQSCGVSADRWVQPHLAVRPWLAAERWSACVPLPFRFAPLCPASWLTALISLGIPTGGIASGLGDPQVIAVDWIFFRCLTEVLVTCPTRVE